MEIIRVKCGVQTPLPGLNHIRRLTHCRMPCVTVACYQQRLGRRSSIRNPGSERTKSLYEPEDVVQGDAHD